MRKSLPSFNVKVNTCAIWRRFSKERPAHSADGEGLVAVAGDVRALRSATPTWTPFTIGALLVLSQVALSLQLPVAVWPRMRMTADRKVMGPLAAGRITAAVAYLVFAMICGANFWLLVSLVS